MLKIGDLRHYVVIEDLQKTNGELPQNALGEPTKTWQSFHSAYASIVPVSGSTRYSVTGNQPVPMMDTVITIRSKSGITSEMRVRWGTKIYNIAAVRNLEERGRFTELLCKDTNG